MKTGEVHTGITIKEITGEMIENYAKASGDVNSIHLDDASAEKAGFPRAVAHGMWSMGVIDASIHQWFRGKPPIKELSTSFIKPVLKGDSLIIEGKVAKEEAGKFFVDIKGFNQHRTCVLKAKLVIGGSEDDERK
ncbi:MaoC family dehydratase [Halobacillus sp. H74]|uniref:MaoC family dehydratase n=1 Tax=Halobacillus sp. H74 TaxID=3457436 RepID=UPI003FCDE5AD